MLLAGFYFLMVLGSETDLAKEFLIYSNNLKALGLVENRLSRAQNEKEKLDWLYRKAQIHRQIATSIRILNESNYKQKLISSDWRKELVKSNKTLKMIWENNLDSSYPVPESLFDFAQNLVDLEEPLKAAFYLDTWLDRYQQHPKRNAVILKAAELHFLNKNYNRVIVLLNSLDEKKLTTIEKSIILHRLAWSFYYQNQMLPAIDHLNQALKINDNPIKNEIIKDLALFLSELYDYSQTSNWLATNKVTSPIRDQILLRYASINFHHGKLGNAWDAVFSVINQSKDNSIKLEALKLAFDQSLNENNWDRTLKIVQEAFKTCSKIQSYQECLDNWQKDILKLVQNLKEKNKKDIQLPDIGEKLLESFPTNQLKQMIWTLIGHHYLEKNENFKAAQYFLKSYKISEDLRQLETAILALPINTHEIKKIPINDIQDLSQTYFKKIAQLKSDKNNLNGLNPNLVAIHWLSAHVTLGQWDQFERAWNICKDQAHLDADQQKLVDFWQMEWLRQKNQWEKVIQLASKYANKNETLIEKYELEARFMLWFENNNNNNPNLKAWNDLKNDIFRNYSKNPEEWEGLLKTFVLRSLSFGLGFQLLENHLINKIYFGNSGSDLYLTLARWCWQHAQMDCAYKMFEKSGQLDSNDATTWALSSLTQSDLKIEKSWRYFLSKFPKEGLKLSSELKNLMPDEFYQKFFKVYKRIITDLKIQPDSTKYQILEIVESLLADSSKTNMQLSFANSKKALAQAQGKNEKAWIRFWQSIIFEKELFPVGNKASVSNLKKVVEIKLDKYQRWLEAIDQSFKLGQDDVDLRQLIQQARKRVNFHMIKWIETLNDKTPENLAAMELQKELKPFTEQLKKYLSQQSNVNDTFLGYALADLTLLETQKNWRFLTHETTWWKDVSQWVHAEGSVAYNNIPPNIVKKFDGRTLAFWFWVESMNQKKNPEIQVFLLELAHNWRQDEEAILAALVDAYARMRQWYPVHKNLHRMFLKGYLSPLSQKAFIFEGLNVNNCAKVRAFSETKTKWSFWDTFSLAAETYCHLKDSNQDVKPVQLSPDFLKSIQVIVNWKNNGTQEAMAILEHIPKDYREYLRRWLRNEAYPSENLGVRISHDYH